MTQYQIGERQLAVRRYAAALISFDQALKLTAPLIVESPKNVLLKQQLGAVQSGRGAALAALNRLHESAQAYERAIGPLREAYNESPTSTLFRRDVAWETVGAQEELIRVWRDLSQREKAFQVICSAIDIIENLPSLQPWDLEKLAGFYAQASGEIGRGRGLAVPNAARQEAYAGGAIAHLRRSIAAGYAQFGKWKADRSLDPLRGRADFQGLMMDLAMPVKPFARGR
jgi:tetratricopeptide (TPR) repeat protein